MVPTKKVEKTPYEVCHGQAPKLSYLKVWGCEALVKRDTLTKPDKLEPRSIRTRHAPDRMCLYINAEEHELGDLGEPTNYNAALLDPKSDKWLNAMNVEMQSMKDNEVWDLVELPHKGKTVGSMEQPEGFMTMRFSKWMSKLSSSINISSKRYHMDNSKRGSIPMQDKLRLSKSQGASTPAELKRMQDVLYASAVGSIIGDIKRELKSAKQSIFATSFAEVEYIVALDASKEVVWVRKFISELGITKGARNFRAKVHYLREVIEYGDVKLEKVHTYDNLADPFTKALAFPKHS
nr:hypothetical protein [Tanacetum cinerariifolium]